jgi:hypothetical protein
MTRFIGKPGVGGGEVRDRGAGPDRPTPMRGDRLIGYAVGLR